MGEVIMDATLSSMGEGQDKNVLNKKKFDPLGYTQPSFNVVPHLSQHLKALLSAHNQTFPLSTAAHQATISVYYAARSMLLRQASLQKVWRTAVVHANRQNQNLYQPCGFQHFNRPLDATHDTQRLSLRQLTHPHCHTCVTCRKTSVQTFGMAFRP